MTRSGDDSPTVQRRRGIDGPCRLVRPQGRLGERKKNGLGHQASGLGPQASGLGAPLSVSSCMAHFHVSAATALLQAERFQVVVLCLLMQAKLDGLLRHCWSASVDWICPKRRTMQCMQPYSSSKAPFSRPQISQCASEQEGLSNCLSKFR